MAESESKEKILVAGGGLVGALAASVFADQGHKVDLYELRGDPRAAGADTGRSINLALSHRGRKALKRIGLEDECLKEGYIEKAGIKMYGRMIHSHDGSLYSSPYGRTDEHYILSISRLGLNQMLLTAAEKRENVNLHFQKRINKVDLNGRLEFADGTDAEGDVLLGADGAFSKVRAQMARGRFNYQQHYIPHGYKELHMKCKDGEPGAFRMEPEYLHIWPRHQFMMIALPNPDGSFTCTLFMPFDVFEETYSVEGGMNFMRREFPDSIELFGEENLRAQFGPDSLKALPLVTVKCSPHNMNNSVIVGDASHAIVPFYGQGMNAGMEDIETLFGFYEDNEKDLKKAMEIYGVERPKDAHAIADLALYNYIEMRDLVTSNWFLFRKKVDNLLTTIMPNMVKPLYEMTVFTPSIPYSECIRRSELQGKVIDTGLFVGTVAMAALAIKKRSDIPKMTENLITSILASSEKLKEMTLELIKQG